MIYYGSEAGLTGIKNHNDEPLRPRLVPADLDALPEQPLRELWARLAELRRTEPAFAGDYAQALVAPRQLAFWRRADEGRPLLVAVSSAEGLVTVSVPLPSEISRGRWTDLLTGETFTAAGSLEIELWPCWGRILAPG